jgi:hypothetical protein
MTSRALSRSPARTLAIASDGAARFTLSENWANWQTVRAVAEAPRKAFKQIAARLSVSSGGQGRFGIGNRPRAAPEWFDRHFITATSC